MSKQTVEHIFNGVPPAQYPTQEIISAQPSAITLAKPAYLIPTPIPGLDTLIMRVTDPTAFSSATRYRRQNYSKYQAWNCDESWLLLEHVDGIMHLLDGQTYELLAKPNTWPALPNWHPTNPYKAYTDDLQSGECVIVENTYNPVTFAVTQRNLALGLTPYTEVSMGAGEGSFSNDGQYCVIGCRDASPVGVDFKVIDLFTESVVSTYTLTDANTVFGTDVDWFGMSPTGDYVLIAYNSAAQGYKYEVRSRSSMTLLRTLTPVNTPLGHSDMGIDAAGYEVLVYVDEYKIKTYRLSDGTIQEQLPATHMASNMHVSCRNIQRPGYAYVSTYDNPGDTETKYMYNECFAIKLDGSNRVERWSQNFAADDAADLTYNRQAHGTVNRKGTKFLFASDWNDASGSANIETYVVQLRPGLPSSLYDPSTAFLGPLLRQYTGSNPVDAFAGPLTMAIARPMEASVAIPVGQCQTVAYSDRTDWLFASDLAAAASTRRIVWIEYDKVLGAYTWKGYITLTYPPATNHTIRAFRVTRELYTTGTVAVSGTTVTGTGTAFSASRLAVGSRIAFGTNVPTGAATQWYEISAIGSDTSITLTTTPGTIAGGSAYVIEDLRFLTLTTNATATNGGLFVAKGLRIENFSSGGTTIAAATTVDNIRAVYWLADASTVTNTVGVGMPIEPKTSWTNQVVYTLDGTASMRVFKYNVRGALTLTAGKDTTSLTLSTATQALTGAAGQNNNGRRETVEHGPGSGVPSIYFTTATRIYRAACTNITPANGAWISDNMTEVPPGSANSFTASGTLSSIEYSSVIDRFFVLTTSANSARAYVTPYRTDAGQMEKIFLCDIKQLDQASADNGTVPFPSINATVMSLWIEGGIAHLVRGSTSATLNHVYAWPIAADWSYASTTGNRLISPAIATPSAQKYYRLYVNSALGFGSPSLGVAPEPFRVYYRTAGINDNTGAWTLLDAAHDLSGATAAASIQFMFEFKTIGLTCIPARIHSLAVVYDADDSLIAECRWNVSDSNTATGVIGFIQSVLFSTAPLPVLEINYYRSDTNALVMTQKSASVTNGAFEYQNGSSWVAGLGPDTVGTRRRFSPTAGLPSGVNVYTKIKRA